MKSHHDDNTTATSGNTPTPHAELPTDFPPDYEPDQQDGPEFAPAKPKAAPRRRGASTTTADRRPPLLITSVADSVEWLRVTAGTSHLSGLFTRAGVGDLVHCRQLGESGYEEPRDQDDNGPATIEQMSAGSLTAEIQYGYNCHKITEDEKGRKRKSRAMFPEPAARLAVLGSKRLPYVRRLAGVIHVPLIRADGTIIDQPGYDSATCLLYTPVPGLTIPSVSPEPTAEELAAATARVREMLCDFPFVTPHDEANTIGMLLTPLLRLVTPPPYKLFAIGAPQPGSGKSKLAEIERALFGGVFRGELPRDDAELEKTLTSILYCTTATFVQFDNVDGKLSSSILAALLTSKPYSARLLGSNNNADLVNDRVWCVTGNNLSIGGDLIRRTVQITINPKCPNPYDRTEFLHVDLIGWVEENRGEILAALLTMVRAWVAAGRPERRSAGADSYGKWIRAVDGILGHAGIEGTFDHADSKRVTEGEEDQEWSELLKAIYSQFGEESWSVKGMLEKVQNPGDSDEWNASHGRTIPIDALPAELHDKVLKGRVGPAIICKALGRWLKKREGRMGAAGITAECTGTESRSGAALWQIQAPSDELEVRRSTRGRASKPTPPPVAHKPWDERLVRGYDQ